MVPSPSNSIKARPRACPLNGSGPSSLGSAPRCSAISGCSTGGVAAISSFVGPVASFPVGFSLSGDASVSEGCADCGRTCLRSGSGAVSAFSSTTRRPRTSRTCSATNSDRRPVIRCVWSIDNRSLGISSGRGAYSVSPRTRRATSASRQVITPFSSSLKAGVADAANARTRFSISSGSPRRAAASIVAFSSPSFRVGRKTNPSRTPTSSPSTSTVPSFFTDAIRFFVSFNLRLKCAARRSIKRSDRRS